MAARIIDNDTTWLSGMNSSGDPGTNPIGTAWVLVNMLNTGGVLSTRPGYRCIVRFPDGNLQGARIFRPRLGLEQLVVVVDGIVYVADYPFKVYRRLENVLFSPIAKQIFWANTVQSAQRITTDFDSAIEIIPPKNVLFMQDGGTTAPAFYDGSQSGHIRDNLFETPIGGPMQWVGDRLWVANGPFVYASDIGNPFSFREQTYLGGTAAFVFDRDVTAMATTPSIEFQQLLVFTEENCSILQADIRERARWVTTDGFQREIFKVGCLSQRSVVNHFSRLSWWSMAGFTYFDAAQISKIQSNLPIRDSEMTYSKELIGEDQSLIAGGAYGQFTLMSVPAEDCYNKHTWVLNNAALASISEGGSPQSWAGYWIGTRPVEWIYGVIAGTERIYHVSHDEDEGNRLWLSWTPDRLDNGCPITWQAITRGYFGPTARLKQPGVDTTFCYADVALVCVEEDLNIGVWYAGGLRGAFKKVMTKLLHVSRGNVRWDRSYTARDLWLAYKPQSRILRTEEIRLQDINTETGSCPVERHRQEDEDESFQLSIVGHGPATIRWMRAFAQPEPEDQSADGKACQDEEGYNLVRFDGEGGHSDDFAEAEAELEARPVEAYESNQTAVVTQKGYSEVGTGHADSIISQLAADRVAVCIAEHAAMSQLERIVPCVLSLGNC